MDILFLTINYRMSSPSFFCLVDLPIMMINRDGWQERAKGICTVSMP